MTFPTLVPSRRRFHRLLGASTLAAAAFVLAACGSSKPQPAPLEAFTPTQRVTTVWSHRLGSIDGPASLALSNGAVTWAAGDGEILSADLGTGRPRWKADAHARLSTAVGSDGRYAAVITVDNELIVFDQGKVLWRDKLPGRVITAPLVAGERVFVQSLDRSIRAYDVLDGRWLWNYQRPGSEPLSLSTPGVVAAFRDTLLVGQGARLVGLDPLKGTPRFDLNLGTPRGTNEVERLADLVGPIARADDEACVRAFQLSVGCVELNRGTLRWTKSQTGTKPVAADDATVVGSDNADRLTAWKTENGELRWRVDRFLHRGLSAPALWGKLVAVADEDAVLHILAADDGRTVARLSLDDPLAAAPVVSGDLLLVLTRAGTVYALRAN